MAKKYNPWTGFLEDTAAKANDEKPTIDKAIRNCDEEQYYKFMLRGGAEYYGTESDMREFFSHLTSKEKKELGTNYKSKTPMSKEEVERWRRNAMNKLGL